MASSSSARLPAMVLSTSSDMDALLYMSSVAVSTVSPCAAFPPAAASR